MKHTTFKIRKAGKTSNQCKQETEDDSLRASVQQTNHKMVELMTMFEAFMKSTIQKQSKDNGQNKQTNLGSSEYEVRDRQVLIALPHSEKLSKSETERWITEVYFKTFSSSFHYYLTEQMTFEQTKVFCSQNVLKNMLKYAEKFKPTESELQNLNKHIGGQVLQYLQKKYPLTQSNDVNKTLEREVQQTNHLQFLTNDFLYSSKIMFKYREDGNYNDLIMKVVNKAIEVAEGTSQTMTGLKEEQSNYNDFQNYLSDIFDNVYDEEWMTGNKRTEGADSAKKTAAQASKEKYEEKVKGYTNYLIGRKISENTVPYSQTEVKSKNLVIKSPAILRILTKWCEELWEKFENPTYFRERAESIQLQIPQIINPFFKWMKQAIDTLISQQKQSIVQFKMQQMQSVYNQQSSFLLKHLDSDQITSIPRYQKASGKFATHMVKNLHTYISLYLNKLIHGLLVVSKRFYNEKISKNWEGWQSPPNLITFKIGDILRCKMASKQRQIVKVFKQIKRISDEDPKRMKIVRIKNRLKQGTHDVLINVKFNNSIICEIQLQVINKSKSKFIQCSNSFSHYIYEMKRSIFGPISELCSIWHTFEARATLYQSLVQSVSPQRQIGQGCAGEGTLHSQIRFDLPFQCSYCSRLYYHNNYILSNKKCQKCDKYKCAKCQLGTMEEKDLKKLIFKNRNNKQLSDSCEKLSPGSIPLLGVCVKIQSTQVDAQVFQVTKHEGKTRILSIKEGKIYNIKTIKSQKDTTQFLKKYFVLKIAQNHQKFELITKDMVRTFSTQQYLIDCYKQEKQVLILNQMDYSSTKFKQFITNNKNHQLNKKIKRLQFASNQLEDVSILLPFQNLTAINLSYNSLTDMLKLTQFKHLQKIQITNNEKPIIFNQEICKLSKLQQIKMPESQVCQLPQSIGYLISLTSINMNRNKITKLPESICNLVNLKEMSLVLNCLTSLPETIGKLSSLKRLFLNYNLIDNLPPSISQLQSLQFLDISNNRLKYIPENIIFPRLQVLRLCGNTLQKLPLALSQSQKLIQLDLQQNVLIKLPEIFEKLTLLQALILNNNKIEQLPQSLKECTLLTRLDLFNNQLKRIPDYFANFKHLPSVIKLKSNCIEQFPTFIFSLQGVTQINLSYNRITSIPKDIQICQQLKLLDLQYNAITQIPIELSLLKQQFQLIIHHNKIQHIPNFIQEITPIKRNPSLWAQLFIENKVTSFQSSELFNLMGGYIQFIENAITSIPIDLFEDKLRIVSINLHSNKIRQIPRDIKLFVNLNYLNLNSNQIEVIPKQLQQLTKIDYERLQISNNPLLKVECPSFCLSVGCYYTRLLINQLVKS